MKFLKATAGFIVILFALCLLCTHMGGWQATGIHYTTQINGLAEWMPIIMILSLFMGFLPIYIKETLKEMQPKQSPISQTFVFPDSNCCVRVKSLKLA